MVKADWNYIENFVDPELFEHAYELAEHSNPDVLTLVDKGIYKTRFKSPEGVLIEGEISFGRKYIRQYHCDCQAGKKILCLHLVAATILYRRERLEIPVATQATLPSKITISSILNQVPKEDLERFLLRYARMDKSFGQALKVHFASRVQVASPEDKYRDLIKSMARLVPNAQGKLPRQAMASLFWISEELLLQAEDLIALDNPAEAFAICHELLCKYASIYRRLEMYFNDFEKYWIIMHQRLKTILDFPLAPGFRAEMEKKLFDAFADPAYPFIHSPHNLFELLYPLAESAQKKILEDLVLNKIKRNDHNPVPLVSILKTAIKNQDQSLLALALRNNPEPMRWISALELLVSGNKAYAKSLGPWLISQFQDEYWKLRLMEKLYNWYPEESSSISYAAHLLLAHPEEKYVRYLLGRGQSVSTIAGLLEQANHPRKNILLTELFLSQDQVDKAKSVIESNPGLDLLKSVTPRFLDLDPEWLTRMYQQLIRAYLDQHIGPVSASQVKSVISFLRMTKAGTLADQLEKWIKKNFQDHTSLSENLN
ncbi:MAG TPA: hypothetical protein PKM27_12820 [Saprospiraceae bacterium]|nr:hypothetical protein [Saprospiraceae bacterium]HNT18822.1 hypothetical protein [Saprospiraceae bacterium]